MRYDQSDRKGSDLANSTSARRFSEFLTMAAGHGQQYSDENISFWRVLWRIFLEILDCCQCWKVRIMEDALEERQNEGIVDFLRFIVRNGLQ